ncbi:tRNA pseudouridine(55) synthase TruB [candidate division KSB1 bacterium]
MKVVRLQEGDNPGWILNVNKPVGKTSYAVVSYVKKLSKIRKVGHAGSLDPGASGVLIIVIGRATKQVEKLMDLEKVYTGTVRFGMVTDTYDLDGTLIEERDVKGVNAELIEQSLKAFSGTVKQVPPPFSALKHKGRPLYSYARKGEIVIPDAREVNIYSIELESYIEPDAVIHVTCSRGTYIRSIAHELGRKLGCGAVLSSLTRERVGEYRLSDSCSWDELPDTVNAMILGQNGSN